MFLHRGEEWDAAPLRAEAGPVPATAAGVAVLLPRLALHSLKGNIALLVVLQTDPTGCTITEKAPTRAFSWLKAATTAFTFKTLLRHYAKRALTPVSQHEIGSAMQLS